MKLYSTIFVYLFFTSFIFSQQINAGESVHELDKAACGTPPITFEERNAGLISKSNGINKNNGFTQLPLRAHIIRLDNGTGGLSLSDLNEALANLNHVYHPENIEWFLAEVNYIDNTQYYNFVQGDEPALRATYLEDDAVNVFFANEVSNGSGSYYCGYAYYPFNSDQSLCILMDNGCTSTSLNGTFVHEFGHHLSLPHTHNYTSNGNNDPLAEHVPRSGPNSNCLIAGDFICDTEADPTGPTSSCDYIGGESDIFGNPYDPPVNNIMSYYSDACGGIFTSGQYSEIAVGLNSRLNHSAYTIDGAPPQSVVNPSGLTAVQVGFTIVLNWNDNSLNETGFLIERSVNGSSYKTLPFGGVAPGVTTFVDNDIPPLTLMKYRVKASNDNPNHYSNVVTLTTDRCYPSDLIFDSNQLLQSKARIPNLPFTAPDCQNVFPITVTVFGDFGSGIEICDILGENFAVLDQTSSSASDCDALGGTTMFNINSVQYNNWASDGIIEFYIDENTSVNDICPNSSVIICIDIQECGLPCPDNYSDSNMLTGNQMVTEEFESDGAIETNQSIIGNISVQYDSGNTVSFLPGFQNALGSLFEAIIDGCGNLFNEEEESTNK